MRYIHFSDQKRVALQVKPKIEISQNADVTPDLEIRGNGKVIVEDFVTIEQRVVLDTGSSGQGHIKIGSRSKIKTGSLLRAYGNTIQIGHRVSVGEYSIVAGHGGVTMGDNTIVGPYVLINAASHILEGSDAYRFLGETAKGIVISKNVWLGARVTILDGVRVHSNAVVAAHSLVREDLNGNSLFAGTPAKFIKEIESELYDYDCFD